MPTYFWDGTLAIVDINAKGYFRDVVAFLRDIGDLPYPVSLGYIKIQGISELDGLIELSLELQIPVAENGLKSLPITSKHSAIPEPLGEPFRSSLRAEFLGELYIESLHVIELSDKLEGRTAIVENGQHEQYLLKVGDRLKDGDVEDISLKELIFKHDTKGRLAISVP